MTMICIVCTVLACNFQLQCYPRWWYANGVKQFIVSIWRLAAWLS